MTRSPNHHITKITKIIESPDRQIAEIPRSPTSPNPQPRSGIRKGLTKRSGSRRRSACILPCRTSQQIVRGPTLPCRCEHSTTLLWQVAAGASTGRDGRPGHGNEKERKRHQSSRRTMESDVKVSLPICKVLSMSTVLHWCKSCRNRYIVGSHSPPWRGACGRGGLGINVGGGYVWNCMEGIVVTQTCGQLGISENTAMKRFCRAEEIARHVRSILKQQHCEHV